MKLTPWVPSAAASYTAAPGMFDYGEFRRALYAKATWFWWQYGMYCPCSVDIDVGQPTNTYSITPHRSKVQCPGCNGEGVLFQEGQYIPGITSSFQEVIKTSAIFSNIEVGDEMITVLREHHLGEMDRLVMVSDPVVVSEKIRKEGDGPIKLRHPVVPKKLYLSAGELPSVTPTECAPEPTVVRVIHARMADPDGVLLGGELVEGVDILVDDNTGYVDVPGLAVNGWLSIRYHTYQVFRVGSATKLSRASPMADGCLWPEAGDGPLEFIIRPMKMGLSKHNPSATFLPPKFEP